MAEIIIEFDGQGHATVTTQGFTGEACKAATAECERALGVVTDDRKTPEYYAPAREQERNRERR